MTERDIFIAALKKEDPAQRQAYLDEACAQQPELRVQVENLLRLNDGAGSFLEKPTVKPTVEWDSATLLEFLAPTAQPGSQGRLGHYEIQEVIGKGGMGVVLRGFDEKLHRVVAIKMMAAQLATSATARRRFTREAQAAAAVSHDHIVTIYAVEEADGLPYLVMQYVAGMSLQDRLESEGPLQLAEILRIGVQTASGLAAAHAQGLIHRDIKPANILLENGIERVKITDFGLARAADDASLTQSGVVAGTPQYMAPEQARGEALDARADLFSLGSVLYAMCTGRAPFRACGTMAVLKRVCEETPGPIREANPEIPDWLVAIIEKLHAKDPAERFSSATEVAEVLGRHLAHVQHPSVAPFPSAEKRIQPISARRNRNWVVLAAGLVCLAIGVGLSEAAGVTHLTATVIRILTPDGTLVVEANDPAVKVSIEGDGGLIITGAGPQEVRLRPGSYQVRATKDGKPVLLDRDLVTITRNHKQVVRVRLEVEAATAAPSAEAGPFVVLGGKGVLERKFESLALAVMAVADGDTIELRGNGPFITERVTITDRRALTIRSGNGFRPVIRLAPGLVEDNRNLLDTNGPLVLEGLEVRCERRPTAKSSEGFVAVAATGGLLHVANCRFIAPFRHSLYVQNSRRAVVTNCQFLGSSMWSDGLVGAHAPGGVWELANCLQVGGALVSCGAGFPQMGNFTVQMRKCSLVNCLAAYCLFSSAKAVPKPGQAARLEVSSCLIDTGQIFGAILNPDLLELSNSHITAKPEEVLRLLVRWSGSNNVYHRLGNSPPSLEDVMIHCGTPAEALPVSGVNDISTWRKFWESSETGSIQAAIRYQGGDLAGRFTSGADKLTPEDFRLRPDSAGYRAGPDGKDLGADVDIVGPGPAYERWKRTPEYQRWLEETRPMN